MRYVACQTDQCPNKGAPYHTEEGELVILPCPHCNRAMKTIPNPNKEVSGD